MKFIELKSNHNLIQKMIRKFIILIYLSIVCGTSLHSQNLTCVYLLPGQGADERIFDSLTFDTSYHITYVPLTMPARGTTMKEYAQVLADQIDTTRKIILIGVSLGGMICTEINALLYVEKTIIISSAKSRNELPLRYRFQKYIPLYAVIPAHLFVVGAKILQPIVEPDRNKNRELFINMLTAKSPRYMKRTVAMIIRWERITPSKNIYHIHGDNDHTIPIRNVHANKVIKNGSHMMAMTRGGEINKIIQKILSDN